MALHNYQTRIAKLRASIVTVDPSERLVEAVTADGGIRRLFITDIPAGGFVWPVEGEEWSIYEENGYWRLGNKFLNQDESKIFESLAAGDSYPGLDTSKFAKFTGLAGDAGKAISAETGLPILIGGGTSGTWQNITLSLGWSNYDVSVQCYRDGDRVFLRGVVLFTYQSGADNRFIGTLPTGHRPSASEQLPRFVLPTDPLDTSASSRDKDWGGFILDNGQIRLSNRSDSLGPPLFFGAHDLSVFILDGISFRAAA